MGDRELGYRIQVTRGLYTIARGRMDILVSRDELEMKLLRVSKDSLVHAPLRGQVRACSAVRLQLNGEKWVYGPPGVGLAGSARVWSGYTYVVHWSFKGNNLNGGLLWTYLS